MKLCPENESERCHKEASLGRVCPTVRWSTSCLTNIHSSVSANKFLEIHKATMHFEHIPGEKG